MEQHILGMTLKQLELCCTSNIIIVHYVLNKKHSKDYVLNKEHTKDLLLNSNSLNKTATFSDSDSSKRWIALFAEIVSTKHKYCQVGADSVSIIRWKPKLFPHSSDWYSQCTKIHNFLELHWEWIALHITDPVLQSFIASVKTASEKIATSSAKQDIHKRPNISSGEWTLFWKVQALDWCRIWTNRLNYCLVLYSRDQYLKQC